MWEEDPRGGQGADSWEEAGAVYQTYEPDMFVPRQNTYESDMFVRPGWVFSFHTQYVF